MTLRTAPYEEELRGWPTSGRHIMAQYDAEAIVVYQAYRTSIASYAVKHQQFGGDFSFTRMSWIKPNFLWMMFRSGWASKEGQEHILAVTIQRQGFDELLKQAVASSFAPEQYQTRELWSEALTSSSVRLQWDPDHDPFGHKLPRRAIQLGLRGEILEKYTTDWIASVEDITPFVKQQHDNLRQRGVEHLNVPAERPYVPEDAGTAANVGLTGEVLK